MKKYLCLILLITFTNIGYSQEVEKIRNKIEVLKKQATQEIAHLQKVVERINEKKEVNSYASAQKQSTSSSSAGNNNQKMVQNGTKIFYNDYRNLLSEEEFNRNKETRPF